MFIHASNNFIAHFKCEVSLPGQQVAHPGLLEGWSCHFIRVGPKPIAVVMNDANLYRLPHPDQGAEDF